MKKKNVLWVTFVPYQLTLHDSYKKECRTVITNSEAGNISTENKSHCCKLQCRIVQNGRT